MKRPFRKRRWDRLAFAALLLVIAAVIASRQSSTDRTVRWLPPGFYHVQQVVDERHLLLCSPANPNARARIRLLGIAAPDPWPDQLRDQAIERLSQLTAHQTVRLRLDRRRLSPDGDLLGYVFVGEHLLNAVLVQDGLAVSATRPEDCPTLVRRIQEAEEVAKTSRLGIWNDLNETRLPIVTDQYEFRLSINRSADCSQSECVAPRAEGV